VPYTNTHIKGWLRIIIFVVAYIFVGGFFYFLTALIAGLELGISIEKASPSQRIIVVFFDAFSVFCVLWVLLKFIDKETFYEIGLKITHRLKDVVIGLFIGLIIMSLGFSFLMFTNEIEFQALNFNFKGLIYILLLYTLVSFKEEVLVRGYFLKNLMYSFGKPIALVVSAIVFSFMHGLNPAFDYLGFINLFLAGVMLGLPYIFNKNLWFPIALHFSWNFFQSLFGFKVSGLDYYSLIEFDISENNIINGGSFGFEGSILSIVIQVLMIISLYLWYSKKTKNEIGIRAV